MSNNIHAVYIGWPKCASTWFHRLCEASPELAVSPSKDLNFFSHNYSRGIGWFLSHVNFEADDAKPIDINHDYIFSERALLNIYESSSSTKVIIFLRYPLDWLISEFNYVTAVANVTCDFETYLDEYPYALEYCRYEELLTRVFEIFPEASTFIGFQEDLANDPIYFADTLTEFLGISRVDPAAFNPGRKVNSGIRPRFLFVPSLVKIVKKFFLFFRLDSVYGLIKRSAVRRFFFAENVKENELLSNYINSNLVSWSRQKRIEVEAVLGIQIEIWRRREQELIAMIGGGLE